MPSKRISNANWRNFWAEQKSQIIIAFVAVFIWGLMAHAYGFLNLTLSHDSLNELFASREDILYRITLGRFMVPVYQLIFHGRASLPWLNGILSLCWLAVSVWLSTYIFSITDKLRIILVAGIFAVNITVTALAATYIHDLDADIFAVMLSVCMVFLWHKGGKTAWLGVPLLVMVLGLYQSMLSVAIALIMFSSILSLLQGKKAMDVVRKGLQAIGIILLAGVVYLLAVKLACSFTGQKLSSAYNGLTNLFEPKGGLRQYASLIRKAYIEWRMAFYRSFRSPKITRALHVFLAIPTVVAVIHAIRKKGLPTANKLLVLVLGVLLPLGMNISCVLAGGMVHILMLFAVWLMYLLAIILTDWYVKSSANTKFLPKLCYAATVLALFLVLATDVQTANNAYLKKDLERQATLSIMTTVSSEMGKADGYVAGETGVVFVGTPQTRTNELFPNLPALVGLNSASPITYDQTYQSYFQFILQTPILQSQKAIPKKFVDSMAAYPKQGYIQWYNDVLVVKLSD